MGEFGALDSYHLKSTKALSTQPTSGWSPVNNPNNPWETPTWLLFGSSRFGWAEAGDFKVCTIHHDEPSPSSTSLNGSLYILKGGECWVLFVNISMEFGACQKSPSRESRLQKLESQYPKTWIRLLADRICCPTLRGQRSHENTWQFLPGISARSSMSITMSKSTGPLLSSLLWPGHSVLTNWNHCWLFSNNLQ